MFETVTAQLKVRAVTVKTGTLGIVLYMPAAISGLPISPNLTKNMAPDGPS